MYVPVYPWVSMSSDTNFIVEAHLDSPKLNTLLHLYLEDNARLPKDFWDIPLWLTGSASLRLKNIYLKSLCTFPPLNRHQVSYRCLHPRRKIRPQPTQFFRRVTILPGFQVAKRCTGAFDLPGETVIVTFVSCHQIHEFDVSSGCRCMRTTRVTAYCSPLCSKYSFSKNRPALTSSIYLR